MFFLHITEKKRNTLKRKEYEIGNLFENSNIYFKGSAELNESRLHYI